MPNNPPPVCVDRYFWFHSGGGYIFSIVGKTARGTDVVLARSYRYASRKAMLFALEMARGRNTHIPVVGQD